MKTIQELEKMTDDELRVILAELAGWKAVRWNAKSVKGIPPDHTTIYRCAVPNYPSDLNACAAVEGKLPHTKLPDYDLHLRMANASSARTCDFEAHIDDYVWSRTARQRAVALILTLQTP